MSFRNFDKPLITENSRCPLKISRGDKMTLTVDAIFRLYGSKISFQIELNRIN